MPSVLRTQHTENYCASVLCTQNTENYYASVLCTHDTENNCASVLCTQNTGNNCASVLCIPSSHSLESPNKTRPESSVESINQMLRADILVGLFFRWCLRLDTLFTGSRYSTLKEDLEVIAILKISPYTHSKQAVLHIHTLLLQAAVTAS